MSRIEVEEEVEIRRPRGDVFAFVSDREHLPAWTQGIRRARRTSPGPIGVGTTYLVVGRMLGRTVESTYELTAYEPEEMFSGRMVSSLFSFDETYRFEGDDGKTRVVLTAEARPEPRLRLLAPLLAIAVPRQIRADHRRLKSVLERRARITRPAPEVVDTPLAEQRDEPPEG